MSSCSTGPDGPSGSPRRDRHSSAMPGASSGCRSRRRCRCGGRWKARSGPWHSASPRRRRTPSSTASWGPSTPSCPASDWCCASASPGRSWRSCAPESWTSGWSARRYPAPGSPTTRSTARPCWSRCPPATRSPHRTAFLTSATSTENRSSCTHPPRPATSTRCWSGSSAGRRSFRATCITSARCTRSSRWSARNWGSPWYPGRRRRSNWTASCCARWSGSRESRSNSSRPGGRATTTPRCTRSATW